MASGEDNGRAARSLDQRFDAVIMLTQSDWRTEPRSNRYHYASRFAARLPTYFVQPDAPHTAITQEPAEIAGLTLVHAAWWDEQTDATQTHNARFRQISGPVAPGQRPTPAAALQAFFAAQGVRRPLLWIYNFNYAEFIQAQPDAFKVFHATEDYTVGADAVRYFDDRDRDLALRELADCDLLVAVSEAVEANYLRHSRFAGRSLVLPNGCDFAFWHGTKAYDYRSPVQPRGLLQRLRGPAAPARPAVFYQGGINARLDFDLIDDLAQRMPDFDFEFCGAVDASEASRPLMAAWNAILQRPNVRYHGMLAPVGVAALARRCAVAITPYRDSPVIAVSLPLKSYEYLACGLPVVSVPIPALEKDAAVFAFARTADEYEAALRRLAPTRTDPDALARRLAAARAMDYDRRFAQLQDVIGETAPAAVHPRGADLRRFGPQEVVCDEAWRQAGAGVSVDGDRAVIHGAMDAWNPAAAVALNFAGVDWAAATAELTVAVRDVRGEVLMSIIDEDGNIAFEQALSPASDPAEYRVLLDQPPGRRLLLRSGASGGGGLSFIEARLTTRPR